MSANQPYYPPPPGQGPPAQVESDKSFVTTWLLAWLLGGLGVDRFYLGKIGTGVLKLITLGGLGVWYFIDLIIVLVGGTRDTLGRPLAGYEANKKTAWIVTVVLIVLGGFSNAFLGGFTYSFN
jgi:hypothetical protein